MEMDVIVRIYLTLLSTFNMLSGMAGGSSEQIKRVCQNSALHLDCEVNGQQLVIRDAVFGRLKHSVPECGFQSVSSCSHWSTEYVIAAECAGRASCEVSASTSKLGNPCIGVWKYLEVNYACVKDTEVHVISELQTRITAHPGDHGYIISPNYPRDYQTSRENHLYYATRLTTPLGAKIKLNLLHLNLPVSSTSQAENCQHALTFKNHKSSDIISLCDDENGRTFSGLEDVTIEFQADNADNFQPGEEELVQGFILEFEVTGCLHANLPVVAHANISNFRSGKEAELMCDDGFQFGSGASTEVCTCSNNTWLCNDSLSCEEKTCDMETFEVPANSRFTVVHHGREVSFSCQNGFVPLNGTLGRLQCQKGTWTGFIGSCIESECNVSDISVASNIRTTPSVDGKTHHFRCRYGYEPTQGTLGNLTCIRGNWTGNVGACVASRRNTLCDCHKVAFSASLPDDVVMVMSAMPLPLSAITLNEANSFNPMKHVFEAPLDGVYNFAWSVHGTTENVQLVVSKNGGDVGGGEIREKESVNGQILLSLEIDDEIWVELRSGYASADRVLFVDGDSTLSKITFMGHLLYTT